MDAERSADGGVLVTKGDAAVARRGADRPELKRSESSFYRAKEMFKSLWKNQVENPEMRVVNVRLLQNVGLFAATVFVMHRFGDLLAV